MILQLLLCPSVSLLKAYLGLVGPSQHWINRILEKDAIQSRAYYVSCQIIVELYLPSFFGKRQMINPQIPNSTSSHSGNGEARAVSAFTVDAE